ncbi:hypothetical protein [Cupriavidus sp. UYPR2.512]|uniref:hypothetical protein n=1 Tax=Cupriavidus sp. UYPR2.512 TaxID=1080187 RepID=UPI00056D3F36|nr:hypothetical protein [Cupriavidus sp. UYPR2.512]UIF87991.1 hypothetical protein KAF44_22215 [Cupriavidus necator]
MKRKHLGHGFAFAACLLSMDAWAAAEVVGCRSGIAEPIKSYRVTGSEVFLRATPSPNGKKLINEKTSSILKTTWYMSIDRSTVVTEYCWQNGWSRVRVTTPDWLSDTHIGWVPSIALRERIRDVNGKEVFTDADFRWTKKTEAYKKIIVAGVNKVYRENSRCNEIDPSTAYISGEKGTRADPVFFVTCGRDAGAFNAYFSKSEAEAGTTLAAAKHIDRSHAINLCEGYARQRAAHPSTVRFSRVMDVAVNEHPNGRMSVRSTFTAKNVSTSS